MYQIALYIVVVTAGWCYIWYHHIQRRRKDIKYNFCIKETKRTRMMLYMIPAHFIVVH